MNKPIHFAVSLLYILCSSSVARSANSNGSTLQPNLNSLFILNDGRLQAKEEWYLGRGYTAKTNRGAGFCFGTTSVISSSMDIKYTISTVDKNTEPPPSLNGRKALWEQNFLAKNLVWEKRDGNKKKPLKNLLIHVGFDSYNQTLDLYHSQLLPQWKSFLESGRLIEFFRECGSYTQFSMRRFGGFYAIVQFESKDDKSDQEFTSNFESITRGFFNLENIDPCLLSSFRKDAFGRKTKIFSETVGVSSKHDTQVQFENVLDLKKYLSSVSSQFGGENIGHMNSIEMIPWTSIPQFNDAVLNYLQKAHPHESTFLVRDNLEENGEFISNRYQINEAMKDELNQMDNCILSLQESRDKKFYYLLDESNKSMILTYSQMENLFNKTIRDSLATERMHFLDGERNSGGLNDCLEQLQKEGVELKRYTFLESCQKVDRYQFKRYSPLSSYCPPKPVQ